MLAKQKVLKEAIDAQTHQMLQQSAGQGKPPTVDMSLNEKLAQLFKPPQQQAGPNLQMAAMGPGMNNQGAAPPNSPPPGMAAGGLATLPTKLPQSYAQGGIIAFQEGKEVPMYAGDAMKGISAKAKDSKDTSEMSPFEAWIARNLGQHSGGAKASEADIARARAALAGAAVETNEAGPDEPTTLGATAVAPSPKRLAEIRIQGENGDHDAKQAYSLFAAKYPAVAEAAANFVAPSAQRAPPPPTGPYNASTQERAPTTAPSAAPAPAFDLGARPEVSTANAAFQEKAQKGVEAGMGISPEQVRTDRMQEAKTEYGGLEAAMRARQAADIQKQRAADAEQLAQSDPNTWGRWLSRFDPNARSLGAGVAAKTYAEQDAYQAMKQKQLAGLRGLQDAQESGAIGDIKSRYTLGDAARKDAEGQKAGYTKDAVSLVNAQEAALGRKQSGWDAAQGRTQAAQIAAGVREDAKAAGADTKQLQMLAKSQSDAMRYAEAQATAQSKTGGGFETDIPALTLKLYNKALAADPIYQKLMSDLKIPAVSAPTGSKLSPADQALVNKYGK
jgi:hypothetical protein